ncbi:99_t:CDS:2, partial [Gigaspora margarita]
TSSNMVIILSLLLIIHAHLTTALLAHDLEGRNLTMSSANISGNRFEKRNDTPFDLIYFFEKGVIKRPRNRPESSLTSGSVHDCEKVNDPVVFSTCCALYNRNPLIDTLRPPQLTIKSRLRLFLYKFFMNGNRFLPEVREKSHPISVDDPFLKTLEYNNPDTRIRGPFIRDIIGKLTFIRPLPDGRKYRRIPFCSGLPTIPEEGPNGVPPLCLPPGPENIIRPVSPSRDNPSNKRPKTKLPRYRPDKRPKKTYSLSSKLNINPLEMANYNSLFAYYDELDSETYMRIYSLYIELANKFADLEHYLRDLKNWAKFLGLSIEQTVRRWREEVISYQELKIKSNYGV